MKIIFNHRALFALVLAVFLSSCDPSPKDDPSETEDTTVEETTANYAPAITTVLQQDAALAPAANGDASIIAEGMRQIDLSGCPGDFSRAYVEHLHEWEKAAEIQKLLAMVRSDDNVYGAMIATGLQKLFKSDANALVDALEQERALVQALLEARQQIKATFNVVENIAAGYGATLPK